MEKVLKIYYPADYDVSNYAESRLFNFEIQAIPQNLSEAINTTSKTILKKMQYKH